MQIFTAPDFFKYTVYHYMFSWWSNIIRYQQKIRWKRQASAHHWVVIISLHAAVLLLIIHDLLAHQQKSVPLHVRLIDFSQRAALFMIGYSVPWVTTVGANVKTKCLRVEIHCWPWEHITMITYSKLNQTKWNIKSLFQYFFEQNLPKNH